MMQPRRVVMMMPHFMAFMVIQPSAQARFGPSRVSSSLPCLKSKKSFTKLESICITQAKSRQSRAGTHWQLALESLYARAVPSITGTAAADSVLGRAARNQAFSEFVFTIIFFALKLIGARCRPRS